MRSNIEDLVVQERSPSLQVRDKGLRADVRDLYESFFGCLDDQDMVAWPEFFAIDSSYRVQSFNNFTNNYPICEIFCNSRAMILDRAAALRSSTIHELRHFRRFLGSFTIVEATEAKIIARASYLVIETLANEPPAIFSTGKSRDTIVRVDGQLMLEDRLVVYDQTFIRNSLVFPL